MDVKTLHAKIRELTLENDLFENALTKARWLSARKMILPDHDLPISKQAKVLGISRSSVFYQPRPLSDRDLAPMKRIDWRHLELPFTGAKMLRGLLSQEGFEVGRRLWAP